MTTSRKRSTASVKQGRFSAHGLVNVHIDGCIARYEAWGPFNEELVAAYVTIQEQVLPEMATKNRWADFSIFHASVMASPGTLAKFAEDLIACARQGLAPDVTAFVIGSDVEGAQIMGPLFAKCYSDAGLPFMLFSRPTEAEAWLQSMLAVARK